MFDEEPEPPPKPWSPAKPIIGMAISVCLFVVGIMVAFNTSCGPGSGFGRELSRGQNALLAVMVFGPLIGGVGCVLWLIGSFVMRNIK